MKNSSTHLTRRTMLGTLLALPAWGLPQSGTTAPTCDSLDTAEAGVRASLKDAKGTKLVLLGTGEGHFPDSIATCSQVPLFTMARLT